MLYFPCQLLPVLTPFTGSLTCVDISCEWTSLGVTSKLPMGNMGRFWAPKTLQRSWFIKDHQGFARYARCCVFNLWVYTNFGETSWTLGFDLWNVRFLWEIEKHDQIDHRNEVTTDLGWCEPFLAQIKSSNKPWVVIWANYTEPQPRSP